MNPADNPDPSDTPYIQLTLSQSLLLKAASDRMGVTPGEALNLALTSLVEVSGSAGAPTVDRLAAAVEAMSVQMGATAAGQRRGLEMIYHSIETVRADVRRLIERRE